MFGGLQDMFVESLLKENGPQSRAQSSKQCFLRVVPSRVARLKWLLVI